ncbi:Ent-kaurene oxidase [Lachnellula occidentalis]|uniref:Ent-kaurene oxidase n=1 Tax=Lachnellula occidentalis TaxID=215460 RepID=A0A8H8UGW7_9HELO|nr:Ent-kaurene oxidase [Lachnellula occidentalis]
MSCHKYAAAFMPKEAIGYLACLLVPAILWLYLRKIVGSKFPRVGKNPWIHGLANARNDFLKNGRALTEEGYQKYRGSMYVVQTADTERLILSNSFLDELRALPEAQLSSRAAQCDRHLGYHTTLDVVNQSSLHSDVCRAPLTKHSAPLALALYEETQFALTKVSLAKCVPDSEDYEYFSAYPMMMNTLNRVMSRALVGYPMCRNKTWLSTAMSYTINAFTISGTLRDQYHFLRPIIYRFLPARREIYRQLATANQLLVPLLKERATTGGKIDNLQWLTDSAFIGLAAINASNMGVVNAIFDLCAMPEYIETLRKEIEKCTTEAGGWNLSAINNMERLDSFLKESQRINHPGIFSFNRKVLKPLTLSNGSVIPKGTFIAMPTYFIARDAEYYPSPEVFQPWRFYEKSKANGKANSQYQFCSTSRENLAFGYGKSACPGRFFAALQMKIILADLVMRYDFKFPDGQTKRPESDFADERISPSKTQLVGFRLRKLAK